MNIDDHTIKANINNNFNSSEEEKPIFQGAFAVIPAYVLNDSSLSKSEIVLFAHLTSLAQKEGYCFASNNYLRDIMNMEATKDSRSIRNMLQNLEDKKYIRRYTIKKGFKQFRKIYLCHADSKNVYERQKTATELNKINNIKDNNNNVAQKSPNQPPDKEPPDKKDADASVV